MAGNLVVGKLRALLSLDSAEFTEGVRKSVGSLDAFEKGVKKFGKSSTAIGQALLPMSAAVAGLGGFALKSAMDFQDSFAGIGKTVEGVVGPLGNLTEAGKALSAEMRQIATEIPVNVNELNRLGEVAGAMGIPMEKIADFSKTMALLGVTTELSAEQAAASIATIQSVYGKAGEETDRFANALVFLGNRGSSSEEQILNLTQGLASAGAVIGLTQPQIMGFGAAMANVGIEADKGGSALSRVFSTLDKAVATGGQKLEQFSAIAGMSAKAFAVSFEKEPAVAIEAFIVGLGNLEKKGINLNIALDAIGMSEVRLSDVLKSLAFDSGKVTQAMRDQEQGWRENKASTDEAKIRFATVSNQLKILWGQLREVGISLGTVLLPKIIEAVAVFQTWIPTLTAGVKWIEALDPATQKWGIALAGLMIVVPPLLIAIGALALAVTAIGVPVVAAIAGFAAFTAAASAIWVAVGEAEKNIIASAKKLYEGIDKFLGGELSKVFTRIASGAEKVAKAFSDLYDSVVGHSSVPKMVDGIDAQTKRLQAVLVAPVDAATKKAGAAFKKLAKEAAEEMARLETQGRGWINTLGEMEIAQAAANLAFEKSGTRIAAVTTAVAINTQAMTAAMHAQNGVAASGELLSYNMEQVELAMAASAVPMGLVNEEATRGPSLFGQWTDAIGGLTNSFAQLAQIAGDSFNGVIQGIGTVISAIQMGRQAADSFTSALAQWRGGDKAGGSAGMAAGAIGGISSMMAATGSKSRTQNVLGGMASGAAMGSVVPVLGTAAGAAVGAIVGWIRSNGASEMELAGREVAAKFRDSIVAGLSTDQMKAVHEATKGAWAGNETGAATLIAISDAYRKMGKTAEDAADVVHRLWKAEKEGGMAVQIVLGEINDVLSGPIVQATADATEAGVWGFGRVSERLTAVRLQVGDAGGEFGRLEIAMQEAAAAGVTDFAYMAGEIDRMKAGIATPVTIPIIMGFQDVSTKADERAWAAGASAEQIRAAAASFVERNQGDAHRLGSALGLTREQLQRSGVPGFAAGTPWLAPLDFGSGSLAMLHGKETIIPAGREADFAARQGSDPMVADRLRDEFGRLRQLLPTMIATAVRDQLQFGARRA